jgi:hypothetical protein
MTPDRFAPQQVRWRRRTAAVVLLATCVAAGPVMADRIYRSVDAHGNVVFSDQPPNDHAQPLELPPLMTFEAPDESALPPPRPRPEPARPAYEKLAIVAPANDEAVRSNVGDVSIRAQLAPGLQREHTLELVLDGNVAARSSDGSGVFNLTNVHRGTHVVSARVVDRDGRVLIESPSSKFHMLQASALIRPRAN